MINDNKTRINLIEAASSYISKSREADLPEEVIRKAKHHILDTLSAIVSGSRLKPGQLAIKYVRSQAGVEEAQVANSSIVTSAVNAAFANGVMGHADETDDHHSRSKIHPGCAIVPAALSMSEREGANGVSFLKSVLTGYEIGCRMTEALGDQMPHATNIIGAGFGASAASAAVAGLTDDQVRYILSYTAQQASAMFYWVRDEEHVEKAFIFGGMPARNGVANAILIQSGFTGVRDPFSGEHNFFEAFPNSKPELLVEGLGNRYEIMLVNIKKYPVGGPIQAPLEGLLLLIEKHSLTPKDMQSITVRLPSWGARIVNDRNMPDVNLQYILAVALIDGHLTLEAAHSHERMKDPAVLEIKNRVTLIDDPELSASKAMRQGIIEIMTKGGSRFKEHVVNTPGTAQNPMSREELEEKCRGLLTPVIGEERSQKLIDKIWNLEQVNSMRELRPLLSA